MKVIEVIEAMEKRSMRFETIEGKLHIKGAVSNMTDRLRALITAFKPKIYEHYGLKYDETDHEFCPLCGNRVMQ